MTPGAHTTWWSILTPAHPALFPPGFRLKDRRALFRRFLVIYCYGFAPLLRTFWGASVRKIVTAARWAGVA